MSFTRRHFLQTSSMLGFSSLTSHLGAAESGGKAANRPHFIYFTKHLQGVSDQQLADITAELGFDGTETAVRPKGHVEPLVVEEGLPQLVDALKSRGKSLSLITTGINEVSKEQHTEKVLRTAKQLGVPQFRMGYFKYDLNRPILAQIQEWKSKIHDLIQLCEEIGIQPVYQNHCGKDYFGAPVWDLHQLMSQYSVKQWGMAFDIYHATVEGSSAWPIELNLMSPHIGIFYVKNFKWGEKKSEACALGEGFVKAQSIQAMKKLGLSVPVSLHVEYLKGSVKDEGYLAKAVEATRRDFATLKEWWGV